MKLSFDARMLVGVLGQMTIPMLVGSVTGVAIGVAIDSFVGNPDDLAFAFVTRWLAFAPLVLALALLTGVIVIPLRRHVLQRRLPSTRSGPTSRLDKPDRNLSFSHSGPSRP
jgi:hypothetical protein